MGENELNYAILRIKKILLKSITSDKRDKPELAASSPPH